MNREQRRNLDRASGVRGVGTVVSLYGSRRPIPDGARVRLNIDQIEARADYASKSDRYKAFLHAHTDTVFTVRHVGPDSRHSLVELLEDDTVPKWLFLEMDLIPISKEAAE